MRRAVLGLLIGSLIVGGGLRRSRPLSAQSADRQTSTDRALFSVKSELVMLNVTVREKNNRYVDGLDKDAFTVFENGQPQPIQFFLNQDAPVTIGLLIDNSGSMQPNRELVVAAASAFVETSNPQDDIFALVFNDEVRPALGTESPFTNDPAVLRQALQRTVTTRGRTALYDAVARGLEYVDQGSHDRKVLVIVSDGADNASATPFDEVIAKMQTANAVVYAVGLIDPVEADSKPKQLREFVKLTGGELFRPSSVKQVNDVLQRVAHEIRHTYVMAFEPSQAFGHGGLHHVRVAVKTPNNQKVSVRTRAGYMAAGDESSREEQHEQ